MSDTNVPPEAVARPKRPELLAAAIEDRVEREQLQPGTPLGTEAQLMAQYEVSRETLRNAIRQLERHGVAVMRRGGGGGGGGLTVAATASMTAVRAITAHLEFSDIGWDEIVEARALLDMQAAKLASRRIDASARSRLRQISAELDQGPSTVRAIGKRHLALPGAIAEISGNAVVQLFSQALSNWSTDVLPADLGSPVVRDRETQRVNAILRTISEAIATGDADAAGAAVEAFSASSLKVCKLLEERRRRASAKDWMELPSGSEGEGKLAQRLALALARDVAAKGWPRERLSDEAGLIERFGVSRSVLREAIRMLELHGIVRPQRGRGGGLMIGRPNADYTIASAKRYLRRAGLGASDYLAVREALERGAIHLAVTRAHAADLRAISELNSRLQAADDTQITALAIEWHAQLSQLGRNRALSLLLRTLFTLTEEAQPRLPADIAQTLRKRHARLTQALLDRDEPRAQLVAQEHVAWLNQVLELGLAALHP
ncbi:MAG: hypothetical protein JWQ90_4915 [Hydrocarboniphaga sp.]|uniref:FadR/GntR family transcriptional regulator n=1 Tax=Hydrocarboniphaga sp. TaxID=2033016 RepID=UPI00260663CA|nr:FCD domain-containing protein [Hydrocarboniphaga sp.]MDB5972465.1 hypothetical protein [Hydrocarboniphaga sp.]